MMTVRTGLLRTAAFGLAALLVAASGWSLTKSLTGRREATQSTPPIPVVASLAETRDVPEFVRALGTVQAFNTAAIRTRVDGPIVQVLFTEGQQVKSGEPLFKIDPVTYQAQVDQAVAKKAQDEALLANAQRDLDRYAHVGPIAVTQQQIDTQRSLVTQDEALVKVDQAAIENATAQLKFTTIVSPFDGRTGARLVDVGNLVQAAQSTSLVTVTQLKPIFVTFAVPQGALDRIRQNEAAGALRVLAYASDDTTELGAGKLTLIDNQVDTSTGTIRLKAQFDNADERLWPGEFVNVASSWLSGKAL